MEGFTMANQQAQPAGVNNSCKIRTISFGHFQANAADMPLDCLLSTPDAKTEILTVNVFKASDNSKIAGQPVSLTATTFSLNLPAGQYNVVIVVGFLTSAKAVRIVESCAAQTNLDFIAVPASNNGQYALEVV
jgi:hypothetical protein